MPWRDLDRSSPWDQAALPAKIAGCHAIAGRRRTLSKADGRRLAIPVEPSRIEPMARGKSAWRVSIAGVIGKKGKEGRGVTNGSTA
jgi:hypothetical protein